ncbi:MAG: phosphatase PAP2 family protein [Chloroflexota bacterium]
MNNVIPEPHTPFWAPNKRRPAFLFVLLAGLAAFLYWLPDNTRSDLLQALQTHRWLVVLLILFAVLTISLIWSAGQQLDSRSFIFFNTRNYPLWLDRIMWSVTQLGNMLAAFISALILFIFNYRYLAIVTVLGTLTLWLLVEIIKLLADRDRPFLTFEGTRVIGYKEKGDSFPSGHTSQIFFLTTLYIQYFQLGLPASASLYTIAALVGFTRIYVGAHYPRDVLAGVVLGSVWGILSMLLKPYWLS